MTSTPPPVDPTPPTGLVGLTATDAVGELDAAGRLHRLLRPGTMRTLDFRPDRVNLLLDEDDVVVEVTLG